MSEKPTFWKVWTDAFKDPETAFVRGLFIGSASVAALVYVGYGSKLLEPDWGTIFSGIIQTVAAAGAAWLAWNGVQKQINSQREDAEAERKLEQRASKAVLPLALSSLSSLCDRCFDACLEDGSRLSEQDFTIIDGPEAREHFHSLVSLPPEIVHVLRDNIALADDVSAEWISSLLRVYQICVARHLGFGPGQLIRQPVEAAHLASDWLILRGMVSHCFRYGRGKEAIVPLILAREAFEIDWGNRRLGSQGFSKVLELTSRRFNLQHDQTVAGFERLFSPRD